MSSDEDAFLSKDRDQTEIRTELSKMSFEELQKLKEKLGSKVYNEAMFGTRAARRTIFKRDNKNRPREISAKKQVPRFKEVVHVKKTIPRDPRFDSLCGTFNEKVFKNSYSFLHEIKKNDLATLNEKLKNNTKDPKTVKKIKYLIQRLENQLREEEKRKQKEEQQQKEKQEIIQAIKSGEKPNFKKKSEKRILNLVSQFEELKNSGKLKRHIRRMRKRNVGREIRKLEESTSE